MVRPTPVPGQSNRSSTHSETILRHPLLPHQGRETLLRRRPPRTTRLTLLLIQASRSSTCSEKILRRPLPRRRPRRGRAPSPRRTHTCRIRRAPIRLRASLTFRPPVSRTTGRPSRLLNPRLLLLSHRRPPPARIPRNPSSIFSPTSPLHSKRLDPANSEHLRRARVLSETLVAQTGLSS